MIIIIIIRSPSLIIIIIKKQYNVINKTLYIAASRSTGFRPALVHSLLPDPSLQNF